VVIQTKFQWWIPIALIWEINNKKVGSAPAEPTKQKRGRRKINYPQCMICTGRMKMPVKTKKVQKSFEDDCPITTKPF
jgi:hypothetical protein